MSNLDEYITIQYWWIPVLQLEVHCCFKFNSVNIWKITHYGTHCNHQQWVKDLISDIFVIAVFNSDRHFFLALYYILHSVHVMSNMFSGFCHSSCELFVEISWDCNVVWKQFASNSLWMDLSLSRWLTKIMTWCRCFNNRYFGHLLRYRLFVRSNSIFFYFQGNRKQFWIGWTRAMPVEDSKTLIGFIIFELCGSTDIHHRPNISERKRT